MRREIVSALAISIVIVAAGLLMISMPALGSELAAGLRFFPGSSTPLTPQVEVRLIKPFTSLKDLDLLMFIEAGVDTIMIPHSLAERNFFLAGKLLQQGPPYFWGARVGLTFHQGIWPSRRSVKYRESFWTWLDLIGGLKISVLGHSLWAQARVVLAEIERDKGLQLPLEFSLEGGLALYIP